MKLDIFKSRKQAKKAIVRPPPEPEDDEEDEYVTEEEDDEDEEDEDEDDDGDGEEDGEEDGDGENEGEEDEAIKKSKNLEIKYLKSLLTKEWTKPKKKCPVVEKPLDKNKGGRGGTGGKGGLQFFVIGDGNGGDEYDDEYYDSDEEYVSSDEDEELTNQDEKVFMGAVADAVDIPKEVETKLDEEVTTNKKRSHEIPFCQQDYLELVQLREHLTLRQAAHPKKSRVLQEQLDNCNAQIRDLIRQGRRANAKKYHELVHRANNKPNEVFYFKTRMSHKEQQSVLIALEEFHKENDVNKPQRLVLLEKNLPAKVKAIGLQKLTALRNMSSHEGEFFKLQKWMEGYMKLPFGLYKSVSVSLEKDGLDACHDFIVHAKQHMDDCVYGMNDAKTQIMQMIGQWMTNPQALGTAIAIHGPPGTGKTKIIKDGISKILGREFAFVPLGGSGDASHLEGYSYTYEGSCWGKIAQILMDSKSMNPVIFFDELDKVSDSARGQEIIGILTHLTDSTQNNEFQDKFFSDFSLDLSRCLFVFSYNDETLVNPILKDRFYQIQTSGYQPKEKLIIAKKYILPKIREQVGFMEGDIEIEDDVLNYIISNHQFTESEQGVRNLKRCLEVIHTKLNLFRLTKSDGSKLFSDLLPDTVVTFPLSVTKQMVDKLIRKKDVNHSMLAMYC